MRPRNDSDIQERENVTVDEARQEGLGRANDGKEMDVPSLTEDDATSYLGVDEPVVPEPARGEPSPEDGER